MPRISTRAPARCASATISLRLARICDTVAIITHGQLRAFGTQTEIMRQIKQKRTFEVHCVEKAQVQNVQQVISQALGEEGGAAVTASATEAIVRFDTAQSDQELASVLARLLDQRLAIVQFREVATDLEDAFLSVTRTADQPAADAVMAPAASDSEAPA